MKVDIRVANRLYQEFCYNLLEDKWKRENVEYKQLFSQLPFVVLVKDKLYVIGKVEITELQLFMIQSYCDCYGIETVFFS